MLIRTALTALTLTACLDTAPPSAVMSTPASPPVTRDDAFCDHRLYSCYPNDPGAQTICDYACLFPSHCQDYTSRDYWYCAMHPDHFDPYYRYCNRWGNPDWETHCVLGQRP
jgi:hypothetical protein